MIRLLCISDFVGNYTFQLIQGMADRLKGRDVFSVISMPPVVAAHMSIDELVRYAIKTRSNVVVGQFDENPDLSKFAENGIAAFSQDFRKAASFLPRLSEDYASTGGLAADFLLDKGFSNFAYFGISDVCWSDSRYVGFKSRLEERGSHAAVSVFNQDGYSSTWKFDDSKIIEWLKSLPIPVGLFACNDFQALKILQMCELAGLDVPSDVSVLGIDNNEEICNLFTLPLTSVGLDVRKAGYRLACQVEEMIAAGVVKGENIFVGPTRVVPRLTVANIYSSDPLVNRALTFIHKNTDRKISVSDVLEQVPLSRRLLEERFRKIKSESIYSYILKVRVDRFANLLLEKPLPVSSIVSMMGEEDSRSLSRRFKAIKGCTPEEWREKNCVICEPKFAK